MTAIDNTALIQEIMDARARRDAGPFIAAMADDFVWRITGTTAWSGDYVGKADVLERLIKPLRGQFTAPNSLTLSRIIAEGDYVVAECRGNATTLAGELYANTYCFVIRVADGKLRELTEYMDTALVERVLRPPGSQ
jgi:ketosteroid isomerase-like protein